jgi:hypothetical protein
MSDFLYNDSELQTDTHFVLCVEECDNTNDKYPIDTRLFIMWHEKNKDYMVRGRRQDVRTSNYVPYAFHCETARNLYDFMKLVMDNARVNITLYNFNNIGLMCLNDITYEFLEDGMNKNYEVTGYDDCILNKYDILKYLKILKNTYNWEVVTK